MTAPDPQLPRPLISGRTRRRIRRLYYRLRNRVRHVLDIVTGVWRRA